MSSVRNILRLFVAMLFSALGASMAFATPINIPESSFYQAKNTLLTQSQDVGFAVRAPPLSVANVAVTGGVTSNQGGADALHGRETVAALFGFDGDHNAPNRGFETPDISTSQIRRNQIAGDRASDEIAALHPNSRREVTMQTSDGPRRVDVLTTDRGAIESKVGRTSADASTMRQVNKDRELLENGGVTSVTWEFRRSGQTGRVGPTPRLQAELEAAGIEIRIVD